MVSVDKKAHILLVSFPGQGHVNPLLSLGKILASKGLLVTFSAPHDIGVLMRKANKNIDEVTPVGDGMIRFEFFDDGLQEEDVRRNDFDFYLSNLEIFGSKEITSLIKKYENEGRPVSCLINNPFIPWVSDVAETLNIPSAMLWVQSCASFSSYYHYHHKSIPFPSESDPHIDVQLPCMPLLKHDEFPSFLHPFSPYLFLSKAILNQFKNISKPFCVLMETFQELENENIDYMSKICPIKPIGPLNLITPKSTVRGDFIKADDCIDFLDSKSPSSVAYVSFGSVIRLTQEQVNVIANGLLDSGVSFLWVLRPPRLGFEEVVLPLGFLEKVGDIGRVVQWCPQEKVLSHSAVACFVTHCGWNSSMEALSSSVPVVAFPGWGDQVTNAKYLVDEFKVGIRLSRGDAEGKIISREEIAKCLHEATGGGETAADMKKNALKWKKKAEEAVAEGGSSYRNLQEFVDKFRKVL